MEGHFWGGFCWPPPFFESGLTYNSVDSYLKKKNSPSPKTIFLPRNLWPVAEDPKAIVVGEKTGAKLNSSYGSVCLGRFFFIDKKKKMFWDHKK